MATGTIKDPYEDIERPICGEFVEIGQPTFAELIWAREVLTRATSGPAPNVKDALRIIAYGKSPIELPLVRQQGAFTAIPTSVTQASASSYAIGKSNGKAYKQKVKGLGAAKTSVDFHTMIANTNLIAVAETVLSPFAGEDGEPPCDILLDRFQDTKGTEWKNHTPDFLKPGVIIDPSITYLDAGLQPISSPTPAKINVVPTPQRGAKFIIDEDGGIPAPLTGLTLTDRLFVFGYAVYETNESDVLITTIINSSPKNRPEATRTSQNPGVIFRVNGLRFVPGNIGLESFPVGLAVTLNFWTGDGNPTGVSLTRSATPSTAFSLRFEEYNLIPGEHYQLEVRAVGREINVNVFDINDPSHKLEFTTFTDASIDGTIHGVTLDASITAGLIVDRPDGTVGPSNPPSMSLLCINKEESEGDLPESPCSGSTNQLFNGKFETSIGGWDVLTILPGRIVEHDEPIKTMKINGIAGQTISDLSPGDTAILRFDVHSDDIPDSPEGKLDYQLRSGTGSIIANDFITISELQPTGQNNRKSFELSGTVQNDGAIQVYFNGEDGADQPFFIDNCVLCVLNEDDCGPGTRNLIANPNFESGVESWNDATDTAITPTTDPTVWDDSINAIIVSPTGEPEVRTTITNASPGKTYSLNFELASLEPSVVSELELIYGILDSSDAIIQQDSLIRGDVTLSERFNLNFIAPSDGIIKIFFKGGPTAGEAKIRNVLLCDPIGECEEGFTKISFDSFEENRGAWAGGAHDLDQELIILGPLQLTMFGGDNALSQTYSALTPGSLLQISFNARDFGLVRVEMQAGEILNSFDTDGLPGIKTFSAVVQDNGTITIIISNQSPLPEGAKDEAFDVRIDDILVCQQDPILSCDGSITDLEVLVEWDGIPRKPTNLFNIVVRYTIRDPLDPFSITTVTHISTNEGVLGLASCDTWKQQGQGGVLQTGIMAFGLTPSIANAIAPGDFASVAARSNYIWSIPDTGGIQDMLSVEFPEPPPGLIESVEVLLLANHITPSGSDSTPVTPPPLLCDPDPASELKISVRFKNSQDLQREFTQVIHKNNIWQQNDDFTSDLWDTNSPAGHGFKGSSARWENFLFILDDVDGRGLDQCTPALFFSATGSGVLNFPEFKLDAKALFVDECLAEILITPLSAGSAVDEVQSIILPVPTGGLWTLTFDFGTVETTTTIPWNASAAQIRNRLAALPNIGSKDNVEVTGSGTQLDPFLVTFTGTLGAQDHNLLVGDGSGLTNASSAFVSTITDGTINERQTISRNSDTVFADLLITFSGVTTEPLAFNRSLDEAQSALAGLSSIGVGNVLVTGDIVDRDIAYTGPLKVDFIGSLGGQNVELMTVEPDGSYTVILDWKGGAAPAGGVNESQLVTVEATGGTFILRVFDIGGSAPAINVDTPTQGGTTETDCYDITFGGTLSDNNIAFNTFFGPLVGPTTAFSHTQQNIRQGGTDSTDGEPEIQRHCFRWLLGTGGVGSDNSPFGVKSPSDAIFTDIFNTVGSSNLVKGLDSSSIIKTYLESAAGVAAGDLTIIAQQLAGAIDEVQTVTISGSPSSGTFALIVEGERTEDLPFNATALQVQNAINGLPNLSDVLVTVAGSMPDNVVYTITFTGADGGRNWQTIVADASDLTGGSLFADTGDIVFDATADAVKTAIVTAAGWLTDNDIDVTKSDTANEWTVTWVGAFARLNIPQMHVNPAGSQLTGGPILVNEDIKGSGSNERQRLQIIRATSGSFTLAITLDGRTEVTTAIPWNTTAAGLEAQILQLTFFDTPGQVSVVDDYPTMLPPEPINSQFTVVFQKIFGDVPLMVADFQTTLFCNPIILPHVPPGPYDYPLPDCDDIGDLSCQSGPLLCKPGDGDDPLPDPDCCDSDTITKIANVSRRLQIERDLFDPNRMINGKRMTLRDITLIKGLRPDEYTPYERNFRSGTLTETSYDRKIETKSSFVLVENDLNTQNGRQRVLGHLSQHREIIPTRFTWPETSF